MAVWEQYSADVHRMSIATRSKEFRTGRGGVTNLAEVGYGGFVSVKEVTTGDMGFAVVWTQGTTADAYGMSLPSTMEFEVSIYVPGTGWTSPANLGTAGWITDSANVAMGHDGNGVAVWSRQDLHLEGDIVNSSYTIYANRYVSGPGWGAPSVVATADGEVSPPQVVTDGNGDFTTVWGQRSGAKSNIFAVRYQQS